jgi:uncharacterized protein (DUF2062 family)
MSRLRGLVQGDDPPWRIALALAVGVFISFTPLLGLQTLLALLVATLTRLNRAAAVAGVWINLPWFAPFVYGAGLTLGAAILPDPSGLGQLSLALVVGTSILGLAAAVVTWVIAFGVIRARRARHAGPPRAAAGSRPAG